MKKTLVFCFFALVLSLSLVLAFQTYILKVKVQTANVRSEPDMNATVVKTLQFGAILESSTKIGEWYEIIVDDESGNKISAYINVNVVNVIGGEAKPVQAPQQQPAVAPVYQQPTGFAAPKTYLGGGLRVLGGLTSSNISYDKSRVQAEEGGQDVDQYIKSRLGPMAGIGYEAGSRFSLEFDVMYMPKGVKFQGSEAAEGGGTNTFDFDMAINEISVPVFIKMKILPGSTPFIFGGGEIGYVLSSKLKYSYTYNGETEKGEQDLLNVDGESNLNRIDFGLVFGGGYEMNLGGMRLTIEARYYMGLANLNKQTQASEDEGVTSSDYLHTKALVILGGIKF
jgi:hypothetical protein